MQSEVEGLLGIASSDIHVTAMLRVHLWDVYAECHMAKTFDGHE
jgi:hypothetical protein